MTLPDGLVHRLLAHGKTGIDALGLLAFRLKNTKMQRTNRIWATARFERTGTELGRPRHAAADALLRQLGICEKVPKRAADGRITRWLTQVNVDGSCERQEAPADAASATGNRPCGQTAQEQNNRTLEKMKGVQTTCTAVSTTPSPPPAPELSSSHTEIDAKQDDGLPDFIEDCYTEPMQPWSGWNRQALQQFAQRCRLPNRLSSKALSILDGLPGNMIRLIANAMLDCDPHFLLGKFQGRIRGLDYLVRYWRRTLAGRYEDKRLKRTPAAAPTPTAEAIAEPVASQPAPGEARPPEHSDTGEVELPAGQVLARLGLGHLVAPVDHSEVDWEAAKRQGISQLKTHLTGKLATNNRISVLERIAS